MSDGACYDVMTHEHQVRARKLARLTPDEACDLTVAPELQRLLNMAVTNFQEATAREDRLRAELEAVKTETERFAELYAEKVTAGLRAELERKDAALRDILERHRLAWKNCMELGEVRVDEAKAWDIPASIARAALSPSPETRARPLHKPGECIGPCQWPTDECSGDFECLKADYALGLHAVDPRVGDVWGRPPPEPEEELWRKFKLACWECGSIAHLQALRITGELPAAEPRKEPERVELPKECPEIGAEVDDDT